MTRAPTAKSLTKRAEIDSAPAPAALVSLPELILFRFYLDRLSLALCCDGLRAIVMKPFLNVFREFNEIDLRNSRFGSKHDPVRFDAADRSVFVNLAVNGFEVLSQRE